MEPAVSTEGPGATGPGWGAREGQEERGGQSPTWVLQAGGTRAAVGHSQAPGTHPNLWATPGCSGLPSQCLAGVLAFFARSVTNWRSDSLTGRFPWCLPPHLCITEQGAGPACGDTFSSSMAPEPSGTPQGHPRCCPRLGWPGVGRTCPQGPRGSRAEAGTHPRGPQSPGLALGLCVGARVNSPIDLRGRLIEGVVLLLAAPAVKRHSWPGHSPSRHRPWRDPSRGCYGLRDCGAPSPHPGPAPHILKGRLRSSTRSGSLLPPCSPPPPQGL